jgi:hypothetical protein
MHPLGVLAAATLALLIYSNIVFYFRPPSLSTNQLVTCTPSESEQQRLQNIPFICHGLPLTPKHALAQREDQLSANYKHLVPSEPRCRRIIYIAASPSPDIPLVVTLALDHRSKLTVAVPLGYSLFLPPTWRAQMEVPPKMVCTLYSSDSVGSLCLRLPKLLGPSAKRVEAMALAFLEDAIATLDILREQHLVSFRRVVGQPRVRAQDTPASCTPPTPPDPHESAHSHQNRLRCDQSSLASCPALASLSNPKRIRPRSEKKRKI